MAFLIRRIDVFDTINKILLCHNISFREKILELLFFPINLKKYLLYKCD
jgi:hypothetical protein